MGFFDMFKRSGSRMTKAGSGAAPQVAPSSTPSPERAAGQAAAGTTPLTSSMATDPAAAVGTAATPEPAAGAVPTASAPGAAGLADDEVESAVAEEIAEERGGLAGLLDKFNAGGLGDTVGSWVGTGENRPVSGGQVKSALGMDQISKIAGKLGISADEAADKVAVVLPRIVDKLTPDGMVPDPQAVSDKLTGFIKKRF